MKIFLEYLTKHEKAIAAHNGQSNLTVTQNTTLPITKVSKGFNKEWKERLGIDSSDRYTKRFLERINGKIQKSNKKNFERKIITYDGIIYSGNGAVTHTDILYYMVYNNVFGKDITFDINKWWTDPSWLNTLICLHEYYDTIYLSESYFIFYDEELPNQYYEHYAPLVQQLTGYKLLGRIKR